MKWLLRTALWFAFGHAVIVACSDAALLEPRGEGDDGTGGDGDQGTFTPASGGRTSSGGGKPSPPVPGTGGRFGAGGSPMPGAGGSPIPTQPTCTPAYWTPEGYCSTYPVSCNISSQACITNQTYEKQTVEQGCGYIRFSYYEDTGARYGRVYNQFTGRLVHYWVAGGGSECGNLTEVGAMPSCFNWSYVACGSWNARDAGIIFDAATD